MRRHRRTVNAQFAGNLALRPTLSAQSVNGLNCVHRELIRHRLFSSEKTQRRTQSRIPFLSKWPVLNCPQVAGFHCPVTHLTTDERPAGLSDTPHLPPNSSRSRSQSNTLAVRTDLRSSRSIEPHVDACAAGWSEINLCSRFSLLVIRAWETRFQGILPTRKNLQTVPVLILIAFVAKLRLYGFWLVDGRFAELLRILERGRAMVSVNWPLAFLG